MEKLKKEEADLDEQMKIAQNNLKHMSEGDDFTKWVLKHWSWEVNECRLYC